MNPLFAAALELQDFMEKRGWRFCFIGGLALARWGEPRATQDVDVSLFTGFGSEDRYIGELLAHFAPRVPQAADFARDNRVPCFVRWPQRLRPAKVDRIAAAIDVMPTVLEVCGAEKPAAVKWDGTSLLPLLLKPDAPWPDRTLFFQWEGYPEPHRGMAFAVRNPHYKLVQAVGIAERQAHIAAKYSELCKAQGRGDLALAGKTPNYELFDIEKDPGETVDLAPQHPEIVEQMKKQYEAWFDDVWTRWHKSGP